MAVKYDRLFHLMIDRKIANAQLAEKAGVSANIITRLKRNQYYLWRPLRDFAIH